MADNSNFILRWEIDDAANRLAMGKAKSGVFREGGFKWSAKVVRAPNFLRSPLAEFSLKCGVDYKRPWKCEAEIGMYLLGVGGVWHEKGDATKKICRFGKGHGSCHHNSAFSWELILSPMFIIGNKLTVEFRIKIVDSDRTTPVDLGIFGAPNDMSNVILKIGDRKLHVSKELLAIQSSVFRVMFFGNFAENGQAEVEIKDVVYEEFLDLLNLIYISTMEITDLTVSHLLKLADRYQMERILKHCEKHLAQSTRLDVMKKLLLADQFRLNSIRDLCLNSFTNVADLAENLKSPEYVNFSDALKVAIADRMAQL